MTNVSTIRYNERKNGVHKSQLVLAIPSGGRAVYLVDKPLSVNVISFLSFTIISQCSCVCKGIFCFGSFSETECSFLFSLTLRTSRTLACPFFLFIHKLVQTRFPCLALMVCMMISPNFLLDSCNPPIFAFEPGVYLAFAWPLRLLHACFSIHLLLSPCHDYLSDIAENRIKLRWNNGIP